MNQQSPSIVQTVHWPFAQSRDVTVEIKRDDLLHPVVSGNKWRKLKYLLQDAEEKGCESVVSMGGNWSNHLHALAFAGKELGFKTEAFVRAHPEQALTPTLEDCQRWGMRLHFTDRKQYAKLRKTLAWDAWQDRFPNSYWIGEGGFSRLAMQGVKEIAQEVTNHYDYIFVGCGSGASLCGLTEAFASSTVVGVAAFSGAEYLNQVIAEYLPQASNWRLDTAHHCGGFAKRSAELEALKAELERDNSFQLDHVYNAKTFLALQSWLQSSEIPAKSKVLVIHTGGLQGNRSV